jgi:hypothetical protein
MSTQAAAQHKQAAEQYGHAACHDQEATIRWAMTRKPSIMRRSREGIMHRLWIMRQQRLNPIQNITESKRTSG